MHNLFEQHVYKEVLERMNQLTHHSKENGERWKWARCWRIAKLPLRFP